MVADEAAFMKASHMSEHFHSLGIFVLPNATLRDVAMHSPAFQAGLGPGDKLITLNGKPYSPDELTKAVRDSKKNTHPIAITALRNGETATYSIDYHGGEKYTNIIRNSNPDILTTVILAPRQ